VESVDDVLNPEMSEELVDANCGLHMSCISSSFGTCGDQPDHGILVA